MPDMPGMPMYCMGGVNCKACLSAMKFCFHWTNSALSQSGTWLASAFVRAVCWTLYRAGGRGCCGLKKKNKLTKVGLTWVDFEHKCI